MKPKIIIICGPTASGKTQLGIECANRFNGEIISADSMQIYKKLDIGTAKPSKEELSLAVHHCIDIVEPSDNFSVGQYSKIAKEKIFDIINQNKTPIIVGGTGLYIKSIIYPYTFADAPKDETVRNKYKQMLEENGKEYIYSLLVDIDPESAKKIHINDTKKVIRALEIAEISSALKSEQKKEDIDFEFEPICVVLDFPREELYERINLRVDKMVDNGVLKEIKTLLDKKEINRDSQSMQAIGYKEFFAYLDGEMELDEAVELLKKNTRNYAKRQLTFFRAFKFSEWFNPQTQKDEIFKYIEQRLKNEN